MATVHIGRLLGPVGFSRTVAIKRLHPQFSRDPDFAAMFLDEARLAARIRHPNVVSTLDVVSLDDELFLIMEYVEGEALARLIKRMRAEDKLVPPNIAVAIVANALHGLHAAHEAKNERGEPLGIVHRDVSPQNVLVGRDGTARVLDFGVAKAIGRAHTTREGSIKGKLPYMSPEQLLDGATIDRRTDVYAASVVLWETLAGKRLFHRDNDGATLEQVLHSKVDPPSKYAPDVPKELDALVMKGLSRDANDRFATAREMAIALERAVPPALASAVTEWLESIAVETLDARARHVAEIESGTDLSAVAIAALGVSDAPTADASGALAAAAASGAFAPAAGVSSPSLVSSPSGVSQPSGTGTDPSTSQVSSISVARAPNGATRNRSVAPWLAAAFALALFAVMGTFAVVVVVLSKQPAAAAPTSSAAASGVASSGSGVTVASVAASTPAASTAPQALPVASASASTTTHATTKPPVKPPPTASSEDCSIPYTVDSLGNKVYKRQCL
jgi:serine/threonine-protein kinase